MIDNEQSGLMYLERSPSSVTDVFMLRMNRGGTVSSAEPCL